MKKKGHQIFGALAEGWNMEAESADAIVKIFSKEVIRNVGFNINIRGS
jgi:hypothetical protein